MRHQRVSLAFIVVAAAGLVVMPGTAARQQDQSVLTCPTCESCTSVLVGKAASVDGATMTSHSCDSTTDRTWMNIVPNQKHKPGEMAKVYYEPKRTKGPDEPDRVETGEIPQVPETYAYLNSAYPIMNEHQLAIGETTFGGKRQMVSDKGIIDCPELYRLVLERAKTAREAIRIADELTRKYGYNDYGEAFTFADTKEVWIFEIVGPGPGKVGAVWAAVRIPDDHVFVSANAPRIRKLDLNDKDHYLASDNILTVAEELGFWSPKSGDAFEFCTVYGARTAMGSRRREWRALSRIAPSLKLDPNSENYPLSVKAEKKLSVKDVLDIFRDTYQDTPFDMTRSLIKVSKDGKVGKNPVANPFMSNDYLEIFNITSERTIACKRATYLQITQSRDWLPNPVGGVVWLGYDNPMTTPHTPFYIGIAQMPASYMVDGRERFRRDSAWWAYRQVSQLATLRWQDMVKDVQQVWEPIETKAFADQVKVEEEAVRLLKQDPQKGREYLTKYSHDIANNAVNAYWKLADDLWTKYTNYFH
ncbi:MAG TPA: C69 family dipeptidase [Vicinamibacterales bacterium]|jgi:dipeptidase